MSLQGSLATMPLPDLLQWIAAVRKTGTLELVRGKGSKRVLFRDGRVAACASDEPADRLGHFLVSRGRITEGTLRDALARQETTGKHLGALLVESGALSEEDLAHHLAAKAEEMLLGVFDWSDASFTWHEGALPEGYVLPLNIRVEELLLRGAKRHDEAKRIQAVFHDPGIVLSRTAKLPPPEVFKNRMARTIYEAINGERTVAEILLHAHAAEFLVTKFLFELFRSGMAEIVEVRPLHDEPPGTPDLLEEHADLQPAAVAAPPPAARPMPSAPSAPAGRAPAARAATPATPAPAAAIPKVVQLHKEDPRLQVALEAARRMREKGDVDAALDLLNAVHRANPGDDALRRLVLDAEAAFVDKAWKHYLPAGKVPVLTRPMDGLTGEALSPVEVFLLSRVDGIWDVKSIIQIAPVREVDALRTLKKLRERGLVELHEPGA